MSNLTKTYPSKKLCGSKTKWSSASPGQGHKVRNVRERGKQPLVPSSRAAHVRSGVTQLLAAPWADHWGLEWDNTTPLPPPIHLYCMFSAITSFALAISTDLQLVQIKPFCSSLLQSFMWTGAEIWAPKVKGWIKLSPSSTFILLWMKTTVLLWPKRFTTSFTVPCNKSRPVCVLSIIYLYSVTQGGSKEKRFVESTVQSLFSCSSNDSSFSSTFCSHETVYQQINLKKMQPWKSFYLPIQIK